MQLNSHYGKSQPLYTFIQREGMIFFASSSIGMLANKFGVCICKLIQVSLNLCRILGLRVCLDPIVYHFSF
jgi:hypothetical protein